MAAARFARLGLNSALKRSQKAPFLTRSLAAPAATPTPGHVTQTTTLKNGLTVCVIRKIGVDGMGVEMDWGF